MTRILILIFFLVTLYSCKNEITIPKPATYLNLKLPSHAYHRFKSECNYSFEIPTLFTLQDVYLEKTKTCHKDIHLGPLNGVIHFSYVTINKPISEYINYCIQKIDEHKVKAIAIEDMNVLRPKSKVYGTLFELQGDVASPFHFYLTDSTKHFASGVIYFNTRPNYDSIKPVLDYIKIDLLHLMNTIEWN